MSERLDSLNRQLFEADERVRLAKDVVVGWQELGEKLQRALDFELDPAAFQPPKTKWAVWLVTLCFVLAGSFGAGRFIA